MLLGITDQDHKVVGKRKEGRYHRTREPAKQMLQTYWNIVYGQLILLFKTLLLISLNIWQHHNRGCLQVFISIILNFIRPKTSDLTVWRAHGTAIIALDLAEELVLVGLCLVLLVLPLPVGRPDANHCLPVNLCRWDTFSDVENIYFDLLLRLIV